MNSYTKLISLTAVIAAISLAIIALVVLPVAAKIRSVDADIENNKNEVRRIESEIQNYKQLAEVLEQAFFERRALTDMFPHREEMVTLVEGLENAADSAGASILLDIVDQKEEADSGKKEGVKKSSQPLVAGLTELDEIPYTATLSGAYPDFVEFFHHFENMPYISILSKISFAADQVQNEVTELLENIGTAQGTIEGIFYIKK